MNHDRAARGRSDRRVVELNLHRKIREAHEPWSAMQKRFSKRAKWRWKKQRVQNIVHLDNAVVVIDGMTASNLIRGSLSQNSWRVV
jgi:hypothetical protein